MKIIYMGTPEFAVLPLEKLLEEIDSIVAVVTQPDKPKGRKMVLASPPVKAFVEEYNRSGKKAIDILQPMKATENGFLETIQKYEPDLVITCAYGKILRKKFLDIPKYGTINIHASLLPKYRGAGPIQWAIINGEKTTGITTMLTDAGMDTGDILLKKEVDILPDMTAEELHDELSQAGAQLIIETVRAYTKGAIKPVKQVQEEATYAPMLTKETGIINWGKSADEVHNLVRGANPWPGVYSSINGMRIRICRTKVAESGQKNENCGEIIQADKSGFFVTCGTGTICIMEVQPQSGKRMSANSFINGYKPGLGNKFI